MILIFGSTGFMGSAIAKECDRRGQPWTAGKRGIYRSLASQIVRAGRTDSSVLVVNAAAFIPSPTVDACKDHLDEHLMGNVVWPSTLAAACSEYDVPLAHLSTGCLFDEKREYAEEDTPTRGWDGYCGAYVGGKKLAEKVVGEYEAHYILRLRLPFDEFDSPRNYLNKLASFPKVFQHENSLTHRGDFAKWALDLWEKRSPYGIYNCVNTSQISAEGMVLNMAANGLIPNMPEFVHSPDTTGARLSNAKLAAAIGPVRSVHEAVAESIKNWKKA